MTPMEVKACVPAEGQACAPRNLRDVPTALLAQACSEETQRFLRGMPCREEYCLELFRRALHERDEQAWQALVAQYRNLVAAWVRQLPAAGEDEDYWVTRAFERLWLAVGPDRSHQFATLAALLRYLKLCTHSVVLDELRNRRTAQLQSLAGATRERSAGVGDIEAHAVGCLAGRALWDAIAQEVVGEEERQVACLSFVRDLKPREIYALRPDLYASAGDVYRVKRNLLDRLRRSARIRELVNGTP